jgi:hypothetical protein
MRTETEPHPSPAMRTVGRIQALAQAGQTGSLSALRRLDPERPAAPEFYHCVAACVPELPPEGIPGYAMFVRATARRPDADPKIPLGEALRRTGISETRVRRLLAARGEQRRRQTDLVARRLCQDGLFPARDLYAFFTADDDAALDSLRIRIARSYWSPSNEADGDNTA